jgi:WD40 repeat protein
MLRIVLISFLLVTGALIIWASSTGTLTSAFKNVGAVFTASTDPPKITRSGSAPKVVKSSDTTASEPILKIETGFHSAIVNKISLTRNGQLVSVSDDKTARLWTAIDEPSKVLRVPIGSQSEGALYALATSPSKDIVAVAGSTGMSWGGTATIYFINLNSGEIVGNMPGISSTIHALSYSKDNKYLAVGTDTGVLAVWDKAAESWATKNNDCSDTVTAIEYLADNRLITACFDGSVRLYDEKFQLIAKHTLANKQRPWHVAISPDQTQAAIGTLDANEIDVVSLMDLTPGNKFSSREKTHGAFSSVAWHGDTLFGAGTYGDPSGNKYIHSWNLKTGKQSDLAVARDSITDLLPLNNNELAYATAEGLIGKVNLYNQGIVAQPRLIPDYRNAYDGKFALSKDGTVLEIGKAQGGKQPVKFSFLERTLAENPEPDKGLFSPITPTNAKDWRDSMQPTLNGKPIALGDNEYSRSIASSDDGTLVVIGADYSLGLFKNGESLWNIPQQSPTLAVNLTRDGRYVVAALGDGTVHWLNVSDASEAMALFITADNRWVAWTPAGYFDHSTETAPHSPEHIARRGIRPVAQSPMASNFVGYHINKGHTATPIFVSSEQIQRNFYRPDLVSQTLYSTPILSEEIDGENAKTVVSKYLPPALKSLAWCDDKQCNDVNLAESNTINVNVPEIKLRYEFTDQGSGIGDIVLKRSGATVATRGLRVSNAVKGPYRDEQKIFLEAGDNPITLSAFDVNKSLQSKEKINLVFHYDGVTESKPSLYVLSIGINKYQNTEINPLINAVNDAEGLNSLLQNQRHRFKEVIPTLLTDDQATRKNIEDNLKIISAKAQPKDVVVIYIAGHGTVIKGQYYFIPHELRTLVNEDIQANALSDRKLSELISNFRTLRVAVLIDSCYAGKLASPDMVMRRNQDATWTGALGQSTGRFVLAASANDQEALDGKAGHGVFTSVLLDALNGKADLELLGNKDNHVNVMELSAYAKQHVSEEAKKIDPSHSQEATWFFMGSDLFELTDVKS